MSGRAWAANAAQRSPNAQPHGVRRVCRQPLLSISSAQAGARDRSCAWATPRIESGHHHPRHEAHLVLQQQGDGKQRRGDAKGRATHGQRPWGNGSDAEHRPLADQADAPARMATLGRVHRDPPRTGGLVWPLSAARRRRGGRGRGFRTGDVHSRRRNGTGRAYSRCDSTHREMSSSSDLAGSPGLDCSANAPRSWLIRPVHSFGRMSHWLFEGQGSAIVQPTCLCPVITQRTSLPSEPERTTKRPTASSGDSPATMPCAAPEGGMGRI